MQQWKSQAKSNKSNGNSLAKMMSQMDRRKIQEKAEQKPDEDYYRKLAEPRNSNYLRLFREQAQLVDQLEQTEKKIETLEKAMEQAVEQPQTQKKSWWEEGLPDMAETGQAQEIRNLELQRQKEELETQYQAMKQQLAEYQEQFERQLPVTSGMLGLIYPSTKEQKLLRYGVIVTSGNSYDSPAELLEQVRPRDQQEEKQWLEGDKVYHAYYSESLLDVEIYMYAVCIVYEDGTSKVFRD